MARDARYADAAAQFGRALQRLARAYESDSDRRADLLQDIHLALWRRVVLPIAPGFIVVVIGLARGGRAGWLPLTLITAAGAYVFIRVRMLDRACARAHQLDLDMLNRMEDRR